MTSLAYPHAQKRLAELQSASPSTTSPPGGGSSPQQQQQQQQQAQQREEEEESRRQILGQILDAQARERREFVVRLLAATLITRAVNRIALVRPERSRAISELLIRMARSGQMRGKVTEQQLLSVLEQVEANERGGADKAAGKISVRFLEFCSCVVR